MTTEDASIRTWRRIAVAYVVIGSILIFILSGALFGPRTSSLRMARQSAAMQTSRTIGLALFQYAQDHGGHYPEGKTSTEVFQQLVKENYIADLNIFFVAGMRGKVRPESDQLKPENVCYDVTCCVDSSDSDGLPVVFLTGYKVTYQAGAAAVPLQPFHERTWSEWWHGEQVWKPFMAVCYKSYSARALQPNDGGSIPNFIPADFDPKGKVYRQLTP